MNIPLRVLIMGDSSRDAAPVVNALESAGYRVNYTVVDTATEMKTALAGEAFDIVISDHDLPQFDAPGALAVLKESGQDIPFIIVSGAIGEEASVVLMKAGAHDYVSKDRLSRLAPAIEHALKDAEYRRGLKQAEEALRESEEKYRLLADNTADGIWLLDMDLKLIYCSPSSEKQSGFTLQEIMAMSLEQYFTPESLKVVAEAFLEEMPKVQANPDYNHILTLDLEFYKKDGTAFWAESKFSIIRDKRDEPLYILGVARDITERQQAEVALREREERYRNLVETAGVGFASVDLEGKVTFANKMLCQMLGYQSNEVLGRSLLDFLHRDDIPDMIEKFSDVAANGQIRIPNYHFRLLNKHGDILWIEACPSILLEKGRHIGFIAIMEDITERKQAEDALRFTRFSLDNAADTMACIDREARFVDVNDAFCRTSGYSREELLSMRVHDIDPDHSAAVWPEFWEKLKQSGSLVFETIHHTRDGRSYPVEITANYFEYKGKEYHTGFAHDITERKQAEQKLKENEEKYRLLAENVRDIIWTMDMNLQFTYVSPSVLQIRGYTVEEVMAQSLEKVFTPSSLEIALKTFEEELALESMEPKDLSRMRTLELEHICKDGSTVWIEINVSFLRDTDGQPVGIQGVSRDITERRLAEEALRKSELRYRWLSEHVTDGVWMLDMNLKPVYQSPSMEKLTGFTNVELMELPFEKRVTPESLKLAAEKYLELMPGITADSEYTPTLALELEYYRKDGTTLWTENILSGIRDENGNPLYILAEVRDITERKLSQEKLVKSYESLKKTLDDAINTMVKIVETRDPYTAGHQQKVADLATAIAREMKLEDARIDQLRMASAIHDIGKIYVPADILSKPGKLNELEFGLIKTHPRYGYDIIKGMDFPCEIAEAVLQHHERLDGSGYPNQLKGEDMLLEAKILAVADVVEAMASYRPYRPALGTAKAFEEITKNKGKLYDPDVVDACLKLFSSGKFEFKSV